MKSPKKGVRYANAERDQDDHPLPASGCSEAKVFILRMPLVGFRRSVTVPKPVFGSVWEGARPFESGHERDVGGLLLAPAFGFSAGR